MSAREVEVFYLKNNLYHIITILQHHLNYHQDTLYLTEQTQGLRNRYLTRQNVAMDNKIPLAPVE